MIWMNYKKDISDTFESSKYYISVIPIKDFSGKKVGYALTGISKKYLNTIIDENNKLVYSLLVIFTLSVYIWTCVHIYHYKNSYTKSYKKGLRILVTGCC